MSKQISLDDVRRVLDEYEDLMEKYGDEALEEGAMIECEGWLAHAAAASRIRRAIFEKAGETDPRAKTMDKLESEFYAALKKVLGEP